MFAFKDGASSILLAGYVLLFGCALAPGGEASAAGGGLADVKREQPLGGGHVLRIDTRCVVREGRRVCREVETRPDRTDRRGATRDAPSYYERDSNKLPFGSSRWWDQMLREDRAGTCCG